MREVLGGVLVVILLMAGCGDGSSAPPTLTAAQEAELSARALADVCSRLCGDRTIYVRDQILTMGTPSANAPEMPAAVKAAVESELPDARFVTSEEAAGLLDQEGGVDGGDGILLFVGPVEVLTAGGDVIGVDVSTLTSREAGWGGTIQFRWTGATWELASSEDTGVTVTSWVT